MSAEDVEAAVDEAAVDEAAIAPVWPRTVVLKHPVQFGKRSITELTFRRPRVGDMKGFKLSASVPANDLILAASRLTGEPTQVIELLDAEDGGEVMDAAMDFFVQCLKGGKTR